MNHHANGDKRRALIIGGTSGIGFALAQGFSAAGYGLSIVGKNQEKLDHAVTALQRDGEVKGYRAGVSRPDEIESRYQRILAYDRLP